MLVSEVISCSIVIGPELAPSVFLPVREECYEPYLRRCHHCGVRIQLRRGLEDQTVYVYMCRKGGK